MLGVSVVVVVVVVVGVVVVVVVVDVVVVVVDSGSMFGFKVTVGGTVVVVVVVDVVVVVVVAVEIVDNVVGVIAVSVPGELAHGGLTAELTTSDDTCGSSR